jgi:hypothetical protein
MASSHRYKDASSSNPLSKPQRLSLLSYQANMFGPRILALVLCAASCANAWSTFQDLWVNGVDQADSCVRPTNGFPVYNVSSTVSAAGLRSAHRVNSCTVRTSRATSTANCLPLAAAR